MILDTTFNKTIIFFVSILSNLLSAISGGGAGLIQLPLLLIIGLKYSVALTTHKLATVALGLGASIRIFGQKKVNLRFILFLFLIGIPGIFIGANIVRFFPSEYLIIILGIITFFLGIYSSNHSFPYKLTEVNNISRFEFFLGSTLLFFVGVVNGSVSSGSGLLVTFILVRFFKYSFKESIIFTLISVGLGWNFIGFYALSVDQEVYWPYVPYLVSGSLLGGFLGAHLSIVKGSRLIKKCFEYVCFLLGIFLVMKGLNL